MNSQVAVLQSLKRDMLVVSIEGFARKSPNRERTRAILSHLIAWDLLTIRCLKAVLKHKTPPGYVTDTNRFNAIAVKKYAHLSDTALVTIFMQTNEQMIDQYRLMKGKLKLKVWANHTETVQQLLAIDVKHHNEHLDQIDE